MVIRKLNLAEWFLHYQLKQLEKGGFNLPMSLRVDMTEAVEKFKATSRKIPTNAMILKALGLWAQQNPGVNRMLFRTVLGPRFLEMKDIRVNFPIEIANKNQNLTAAISIRNPHLKSVDEIHAEIRAAKQKPLAAYPINQFLSTRRNWFLNRWLLKTLYFLTMRSPRIYWKLGGGGLTYSSLTHAQDPKMIFVPVARGNTGLTFCLNSVEHTATHCYFHFGVSFDHSCHTGAEMSRWIKSFTQILTSLDVTCPDGVHPLKNDTMFNSEALF